MPIYDALNWYWRAEDGRLYGSKVGGVIAEDDADFVAWTEDGGVPTIWPRDEVGEQTQAELDAVIAAGRPRSALAITTKADLFRRATDAEAEMIDAALKTGPVRERLIFEHAQHLDHADPLFANMRTALSGMFGPERADELLAPSAA